MKKVVTSWLHDQAYDCVFFSGSQSRISHQHNFVWLYEGCPGADHAQRTELQSARLALQCHGKCVSYWNQTDGVKHNFHWINTYSVVLQYNSVVKHCRVSEYYTNSRPLSLSLSLVFPLSVYPCRTWTITSQVIMMAWFSLVMSWGQCYSQVMAWTRRTSPPTFPATTPSETCPLRVGCWGRPWGSHIDLQCSDPKDTVVFSLLRMPLSRVEVCRQCLKWLCVSTSESGQY